MECYKEKKKKKKQMQWMPFFFRGIKFILMYVFVKIIAALKWIKKYINNLN